MNKVVFFFILSLFFTINYLYSKNLEFYREDLTFTLTKTHLKVDGLYYFRNDADKEVSYLLFYPYPPDSLMGSVDSTFAFDPHGKSCKLHDRRDGMTFSATVSAQDTTVYRIGYRQSLINHSARYILITTQSWGKPFEEVTYQVISKLKHLKFNYPPDQVKRKGKERIYIWHKNHFMPDKDFIIQF
jgi:hypothetical protein